MALTDNLLAFYKLSDLSDSSGNNRTLTNNGNVSFASGKIGNAAVFDGTNSLTFDLPEMTDLSCSFWVKFNSINSDISLLGKLSNDFFGAYYDAAGQRMLFVRHGIGEMIANEFVPQIGEWYFISVTRSGSSFKININGTSSSNDSGDSASFNSGTYAMSVNPNDTYASGQVLDGQIDAVGIWNRALSDAEVAELYNNVTGLELGSGGENNYYKIAKIQGKAKFFGNVKFFDPMGYNS
jgi:hypothetical protein